MSAIDEICRMTLDFHAQSRAESGTTVSVSVINRGTRMNVATQAKMGIDARIASTDEAEQMTCLIQGLKPHKSAATVLVSGPITPPLIERSSRIADLYEYTKRVGAELRIDLAEASVGGASDGSFCAGVNRSVLDGPGLVGDGGDALTEHTWWVSDMAPRATFVARMLEWVPISQAGNGEPF